MQQRPLSQFGQWIASPIASERLVSGVAVDSRKIVPGDLFFALPGARVDGHDYLLDADKRGAVAAVVKAGRELPQGVILPLLPVPDPLAALHEAARRYREELSSAPIYAVTGSVGKTTVKEFAAALLRQKYRLLATAGNENSQTGVPLTLFNLGGKEELILLEMGMNGPGQIARLVEIAPPRVALITTVTLTHSQFFPGLEAIAMAKAEIFSHPKTELGLLPQDLPNFSSVCQVGSCRKAIFRYTVTSQEGAIAIEDEGKRLLEAPWSIPGLHNRTNFALAALLAHEAGMEWDEIAAAAPLLRLPAMRFETMVKEGITVIKDCYNACQLSMESALQSLPAATGRRIALLGEMGELGRFSEGCHLSVAEAALGTVDELVCYGKGCLPMVDLWKRAGRPVNYFEAHPPLLDYLKGHLQEGDLLLVKGSRSCALERIVEQL